MNSERINNVASLIPRSSKRRKVIRRGSTNWPLTVAAAFLGVIFFVPALWMVIGSFRQTKEIFETMSEFNWSLLIPSEISLDNYEELMIRLNFDRALWVSAFTTFWAVFIGLCLAISAAYALGVLNFPGRGFVFSLVIISFMMPFDAIAIPLSQLFTDWGLANTAIGLILPAIANGLAIFQLRQYFLGIPRSFRESAMIDGASEPQILWKVYLPISGPALINCGLLLFLGKWTAYLWPLLIVSDVDLQVAPIALARTFGERAANYGANFAGSVILSLVPALIIFALQRNFGRIDWGSEEK